MWPTVERLMLCSKASNCARVRSFLSMWVSAASRNSIQLDVPRFDDRGEFVPFGDQERRELAGRAASWLRAFGRKLVPDGRIRGQAGLALIMATRRR